MNASIYEYWPCTPTVPSYTAKPRNTSRIWIVIYAYGSNTISKFTSRNEIYAEFKCWRHYKSLDSITHSCLLATEWLPYDLRTFGEWKYTLKHTRITTCTHIKDCKLKQIVALARTMLNSWMLELEYCTYIFILHITWHCYVSPLNVQNAFLLALGAAIFTTDAF